MKKGIVLLLVISLLLCGCSSGVEEETVAFYYPVLEMDYSIGTSYLQAEIRSKAVTGYILTDILNLYLQGPNDRYTYAMPFQYNTKVHALVIENGVMELTLTRGFATYTGLPLTIACACIAKTAIELTGVDSVKIKAYQSTLDGAAYIEMNRNSLLLIESAEPKQE